MFTENTENSVSVIEKERMQLLNDFIFQKIFAEHEELLIPLLNAILDAQIQNIDILPRDLSGGSIEEKFSILDIKAITNKGEKINIEVQLSNKGNMIHRTLFYWSRLFTEKFKRKENYRKLKRTIAINILGYRQFRNSDALHHVYQLYDTKNKEHLTDLMEIHFLEVPKFNSSEADFSNPLNRWLLSFEEEPDLRKLKEVVDMDGHIREVESILEELNKDDAVRHTYLTRQEELLDYYSSLEDAMEEGKEEGRKEGREEGKEEIIKEMVIKMLQQNISEDLIKSVTKVTDKTLEKLKEELD